MHVRRIALTDFRNYAGLDLALEPGVTLLLGPNGQGKTNLVEAIGYLTALGSHRVSQDAAMVRAGSQRAIVRALIRHRDREVAVDLELAASGSNRAQVAGNPVRLRELPRFASSVLFAPEDLAIVRGEPSGRRRYLDALLVQLVPRIAGVIADYERVLKQRNSLLKSARAQRVAASALGTLDVWDERLVSLGTELMIARADLTDQLRPEVQRAYRSLTESDHGADLRPALSVLGSAARGAGWAAAGFGGDSDEEEGGIPIDRLDPTELAETFRTALARVRPRELERAVSLIGPHRDDLDLQLNALPVRGFASHGESWSFALALKLGAAQLIRSTSPLDDPVLILDDVFAELDEGRRARLAGAIGDFEQVLITAAVGADVPAELNARVLQVRAGVITEGVPTDDR